MYLHSINLDYKWDTKLVGEEPESRYKSKYKNEVQIGVGFKKLNKDKQVPRYVNFGVLFVTSSRF